MDTKIYEAPTLTEYTKEDLESLNEIARSGGGGGCFCSPDCFTSCICVIW